MSEMLRRLRGDFFAKATEKEFRQEVPMLQSAITFPARYLNDRGVRLPGSNYKAILLTVINTIKQHGNRDKIRRFSVYFLDCVQKHMAHHGDEYYQQAKDLEFTRAGDAAASVVRRLGAVRSTIDRTVEVFAQTNTVLAAGRRRKKAKSGTFAGDLFAPCKRRAPALQKP